METTESRAEYLNKVFVEAAFTPDEIRSLEKFYKVNPFGDEKTEKEVKLTHYTVHIEGSGALTHNELVDLYKASFVNSLDRTRESLTKSIAEVDWYENYINELQQKIAELEGWKKPEVTLYGIWVVERRTWLKDGNGRVFHTMSPVVAEAQLNSCHFGTGELEIRKFE